MSENLMIAHREWAARPPDQRFQSLDALEQAVQRRRELSHEVGVATKAIRLIAGSQGDIEVADTGARLTHWSFGQAASLGAAPAGFLRELPAPMAADVLNHRLQHADRESLQVLVGADPDAGGVAVRAFTSDRYGRIWDADVIRMVRQITDGTSWKPPLGFENGKWGAPLVPSGLYASDRDCFIFLTDLEHPIDGRGDILHRGFIVQNSEVGSKTFSFLAFMMRRVCSNHIVWGGEILGEINIRHLGNAMERASFLVEPVLQKYLESDTTREVQMIERARAESVGSNDDEAIGFLQDVGFGRQEATQAVGLAVMEEGGAGTLWQVVQGLTALARQKQHTDERVALERRAGALLKLAAN
ncbi:MAG: DUF932 domain-containing protein [Candidatus Riflebacteria bacterium]|nr:DUF932 domain-containing protein [Candidatus Riflebacteria bacterium]